MMQCAKDFDPRDWSWKSCMANHISLTKASLHAILQIARPHLSCEQNHTRQQSGCFNRLAYTQFLKLYTLHTHICFWHSCLIDKRKQHQPLAWLGHLIKSPWNMALGCSEIVLRRSNLEKWKIKKKGENTVTVHVGYLSLVDEQVNLDCSLPKA